MDHNEVRIHYAMSFLKLSLWYVQRLMRIEKIPFEQAVNERVNIYRHTDFFQGGDLLPARGHTDRDWDAFLPGLKEIFDRHPGEPDALEEEGVACLWPHVRKSGEGDPSRRERPYECWTFEDGDDYIALHITNVYRPRSPLSEMRGRFATTLLQLLEDAKKRRPEAAIVRCGSWLNSAPPFQALFPESWRRGAVLIPKSGYGLGHWGQFSDRTGRFHERNGAAFRKTGEFPYPSLGCRARIDEVVAHLRQHEGTWD